MLLFAVETRHRFLELSREALSRNDIQLGVWAAVPTRNPAARAGVVHTEPAASRGS